MRVVVRDFGSTRTHLADVESTTATLISGQTYLQPPDDTRALCGDHIYHGFVMSVPLERVKCQECRRVRRKEDKRRGKDA
jgi:hypothetical protein